jgi:hypothetical protein
MYVHTNCRYTNLVRTGSSPSIQGDKSWNSVIGMFRSANRNQTKFKNLDNHDGDPGRSRGSDTACAQVRVDRIRHLIREREDNEPANRTYQESCLARCVIVIEPQQQRAFDFGAQFQFI